MPMSPRLLRPRARGGFDPRSVAGLLAWWDAADSSTLFDATSGGSAVAADGAVARWQDKSGAARHVTQTTSNNRPLRKVAVQNGRDVLEFDGTNDSLNASAISIANPVGGTLFWIAKRNAGSTGEFLTVMEVAQYFRLVYSTTSGNLQTGINFIGWPDNGTTSVNPSLNISVATDSFLVGCLRYNGGTATAAASYNARTQRTSRTVTQNTNNGTLGRVDGIGIGSRSSAAGYTGVQIGEILLYGANLTDAQVAAIENYLAAKWGL